MIALGSIQALARAGASAQAWAAFEAAGLGAVVDDPRVLTLKGRLLKDRASVLSGASRIAMLRDARTAYADAAQLEPATYPLINAATLAQMAGDSDAADALARRVLTMLDSGAHTSDTPYWLGASRAEAQLLLGDVEAAQASLAAAMARAPRAWEDHAITLRQFRRLLAANGLSSDWLGAFDPPPSLYFSGITGVAADDAPTIAAIGETVAAYAPAAVFGALAAGADILIAEAALALGAELYIVLPSQIEPFLAHSVRPLGDGWSARFAALIEAATEVELLDEPGGLSDASLLLANDMAMGLAIRHATLIGARPVALHIAAPDSVAAPGRWEALGLALTTLHAQSCAGRASPVAQQPAQPMAVLGYRRHDDSVRAAPQIEYFDDLALAAQRAVLLAAEGAERVALDLAVLDAAALPPRLVALLDANVATPVLASRTAALALALDASLVTAQLAGEITDPHGAIEYYTLRG